ncbi:MAG: hypothetical protein AAF432_08495 [Planctomycetota bacterium]
MTSSPLSTTELTRRLATLELETARQGRRVRRWRQAAVCGLALLVVGVLAGGAAVRQHLMEARAFILRDALGQMRGSFVVSDDGGVRLTFFDNARTAKAGIWLEPSGQASVWGFDQVSGQSTQTATPAPTLGQAQMPNRAVAPRPMQAQFHDQMHTQPTYPALTTASGQMNAVVPTTQTRPAQTVAYQAPTGPMSPYAAHATNALVMLGSTARVIEKTHETWTCGYQVAVRNDARRRVEQAYYVTFIDQDGFVLARQARMLRLEPYQQTTLNGEIELSSNRAAQIAHVKLTAWTP